MHLNFQPTYIQIGKEEMYIEKVSGNKLTVKRGQDKTTVSEHVLGGVGDNHSSMTLTSSKLETTLDLMVLSSEVNLCLISMRRLR